MGCFREVSAAHSLQQRRRPRTVKQCSVPPPVQNLFIPAAPVAVSGDAKSSVFWESLCEPGQNGQAARLALTNKPSVQLQPGLHVPENKAITVPGPLSRNHLWLSFERAK